MRRALPGSIARRGHRVDAAELGVGVGEAVGVGDRIERRRGPRGPRAGTSSGSIDRLHVEPGAADEQRALAARLDVGDRGARLLLEARDRPLLARVGDVDQVVRHRGPLGGGGLGGADVEAAVDLHRVDRHDLDVAERARDARARAPTSRTRWGRRARGADCARHAGAAVTGMRMRTGRGAAVDRDELAAQPVRRGVGDRDRRRCRPAHRLAAARRRSARACSGGCGPTTWSASFFDGPSTQQLLDAPDPRLVLGQRVPLDHVGEPAPCAPARPRARRSRRPSRPPACRAAARTRTCTRRRRPRRRPPRACARSRRRSRPGSRR